MAAPKRLTKSKRFNEVVHILLTHNFPVVLKELAFYGRKPSRDKKKPTVATDATPLQTLPHRVRLIMEDLGPSFIKIGQLLGTRPDLIPPEFIEEFKKLYDQTTPTPFPQVRTMVESELDRPLEQTFLRFDETPLASASIAQVHRAVLMDGREVAVKVQHPGIDERMRLDFEILRGIVNFTERVFAASRVWQPASHLEEIRQMLNKELDFSHEVSIQQKVRVNFEDDDDVKIPAVFQEFCTRRVVVMEFIDGIKFRSRDQPELADMDRSRLARIIANAMAKQIFVDRLFHADPSPGNLLILTDGRVCFLDFGAFGRVTERRARVIFEMIVELNRGSLEGTARTVLELCDQRGEYDAKRFLHDLEGILDYYEIERPSPADPVLLDKILQVAKNHNMLLPPDFMLITRALYQFDGMCKELAEDYELIGVLTPFVGKVAREHFLSPEAQLGHLRDAASELGTLIRHLPGHIERILTKLEKGDLVTQIEVKGLQEHARGRARLTYLASFTALVAAEVIGGAIIAAFAPQAMVSYAVGSIFLMAGWLLVLLAVHERGHRR